jgi:hypothetical protein
MSQPGNQLVYLTGFVACDVAKLTGLPIYCRPRVALKTYPEDAVHPVAAEEAIQRGAWRHDDVLMDLSRMEWWDRWKVAWALIGGHAYIDVENCRLAA